MEKGEGRTEKRRPEKGKTETGKRRTGNRRPETLGRQDEGRTINVGWLDGVEKSHDLER